MQLLILGTGIFSAEVADLAREIPGVSVAGFVVNLEPPTAGATFEGAPVYWVEDLAPLADTHVAVCAIGSTKRARFTAQVEAQGMRFVALIHPTARVSPTATLGPGTVVSAGVIIASHTHLGAHVIVNRGALIGHHTSIGDCVTIGPGANVAGAVVVESGAYLAMSCVVLDRMTIGADAVVGAGAVVTKPVAAHTQVVGVPARVVRTGIEGR